MKLYIDSTPNESGAYPNPKLQPFPGCIALDEEQSQTFLDYNGFVTISVDAGKAISVTANTQAWEEWKESLQPEPEPEPEPEYVTYEELAAAIREGVNAV